MESNHAPLSYQESVLTDELGALSLELKILVLRAW